MYTLYLSAKDGTLILHKRFNKLTNVLSWLKAYDDRILFGVAYKVLHNYTTILSKCNNSFTNYFATGARPFRFTRSQQVLDKLTKKKMVCNYFR